MLRQHLVQGYSLHQVRFEQNAAELEQALALIRKAASSPTVTADAGSILVEIVIRYTQTFLWLQRYDEGLLNEPDGQPGGILPSEAEAYAALLALKQSLLARGEATELFARPLGDGLVRCWATWIRRRSASRPIRRWRARRRVCCISW